MDYICKYQSPLGGITLAGNGNYLTGLWFDGQKYDKATLSSEFEEKKLHVFKDACRWLDTYFLGIKPKFKIPIYITASDFCKNVWDILLNIPYGETVTYGEIARILEKQHGIFRVAPRAVGGAVGRNPISIIIPCHRVVGANGKITGYAGGIEKKIRLLSLEQGNIAK